MSAEELVKLKKEIKSELLQELTGKPPKADRNGVFDEVRNKYRDQLHKAYGTYHYDQVWQCIRKLSCYMAGVCYVRELSPSIEFKAAEAAEILLKMVIEAKEI
jgi:hypothetical protein